MLDTAWQQEAKTGSNFWTKKNPYLTPTCELQQSTCVTNYSVTRLLHFHNPYLESAWTQLIVNYAIKSLI